MSTVYQPFSEANVFQSKNLSVGINTKDKGHFTLFCHDSTTQIAVTRGFPDFLVPPCQMPPRKNGECFFFVDPESSGCGSINMVDMQCIAWIIWSWKLEEKNKFVVVEFEASSGPKSGPLLTIIHSWFCHKVNDWYADQEARFTHKAGQIQWWLQFLNPPSSISYRMVLGVFISRRFWCEISPGT